MKKQQLIEWVSTGRELEFEYQGHKYSITYQSDDRRDYISFCEFYQEPLDVASVDALWDSSYKGIELSKMLSSIPKDEIDVA